MLDLGTKRVCHVPFSTQGAMSPRWLPTDTASHTAPHDSVPRVCRWNRVAWTNAEAQMTAAKQISTAQSVPDVASKIHTLTSCPQSSARDYLPMGLKEATEVKRGHQGGRCSRLTGAPMRRGDRDTGTHRTAHEDTGRRRLPTRPGEAPGTSPVTPWSRTSSLQDRTESVCCLSPKK